LEKSNIWQYPQVYGLIHEIYKIRTVSRYTEGTNKLTGIQLSVDAVILDLDGVITHTAELHKQAWKRMFDSFLQSYSNRTGRESRPMDPENDYKEYIDGRPRYEGAQEFLKSRNINLTYGSSDDEPGKETICGLGNRKNEIYRSLLQEKGVTVYSDAIEAIHAWHKDNKKVAVVSSSRNCRDVLSVAGIHELFDAIVDGNESHVHGLHGKPEPDIFLFAAKLLGVEPSRAFVVEDAVSGVEAGKQGHFAMVIGVIRDGDPDLLYKHGADIVVSSLSQIKKLPPRVQKPIEYIPSALVHFEQIAKECLSEKKLLLLDYDGTLTPIVSRPEEAVLSDMMRETVRALANKMKVAIISGRGLADVKHMVGLQNVYYAGSHGFEIEGPDGEKMEPQAAIDSLPQLDAAERAAASRLSNFKDIIVERKKYSLAVHFRLAAEETLKSISKAIDELASEFKGLRVTGGKKVIELRPAIDWDKGRAVEWIAEHLFSQSSVAFPLYLGDDITDEDAFKRIKGWGISILVSNHEGLSFADYQLADTIQVKQFLKRFHEAGKRQ
jgi:alpha,alpha-trehalase